MFESLVHHNSHESREKLNKIEVRHICNQYDVFLVHALPDGYVVDTSLYSNHADKSFENLAKNIVHNPIPNLACSSFGIRDYINRFQNRMQGLLILGGHVIYANQYDGMTWADENFTDLNTINVDDMANQIDKAINSNTRMNEIHVDTRNGLVIPYLDLDIINHMSLFYSNEKENTISTLKRVNNLCESLNCPIVGIYRGSVRKVQPDVLIGLIEEFKPPLEISMKTSTELDYLFKTSKEYSLNQLCTISIKVPDKKEE